MRPVPLMGPLRFMRPSIVQLLEPAEPKAHHRVSERSIKRLTIVMHPAESGRNVPQGQGLVRCDLELELWQTIEDAD